MRRELTKKQARILSFIAETVRREGYPPTIREIGERFGISSTNGVRSFLDALEKKGYIKRKRLVSRGIELLDYLTRARSGLAEIPVIGRVAAGQPILALQNIEDTITLDSSLFPSEDTFALKVNGDSMKDAGILDGDYVLARHQESAERGDIVVAIIEDEATVKRYFPENGRVRLEPANEAFEPIVLDRNVPGFRIAGKVVGLLRKM